MKVLKYIVSVFLLAAVTLAALYFPNFYFQKYQYETVIEEMEQHSYEEIGSSKANLWQVSKMLEDMSYKETSVYTHRSGKIEVDREIEMGYKKMVQKVFEKYMNLVEEDIKEEHGKGEQEIISEGAPWNVFQSWMKNWINEEKDWQVNEATLFDLADVFSGELINIQLYGISFEIPEQNISMDICFSPDTEIFYMIHVEDERFLFETETDELSWELYAYYKKQGESDSILEKFWNEMMNVQVFANELYIGFFK